MNLSNIDHVEVLKGPQGTLFGRNTTGGVIQIVTKDPSETPEGQRQRWVWELQHDKCELLWHDWDSERFGGRLFRLLQLSTGKLGGKRNDRATKHLSAKIVDVAQ
ncbi:MAG: TonB-dependent receptor plug domain-containing protein [Rhizomicrobium sp.]